MKVLGLPTKREDCNRFSGWGGAGLPALFAARDHSVPGDWDPFPIEEGRTVTQPRGHPKKQGRFPHLLTEICPGDPGYA